MLRVVYFSLFLSCSSLFFQHAHAVVDLDTVDPFVQFDIPESTVWTVGKTTTSPYTLSPPLTSTSALTFELWDLGVQDRMIYSVDVSNHAAYTLTYTLKPVNASDYGSLPSDHVLQWRVPRPSYMTAAETNKTYVGITYNYIEMRVPVVTISQPVTAQHFASAETMTVAFAFSETLSSPLSELPLRVTLCSANPSVAPRVVAEAVSVSSKSVDYVIPSDLPSGAYTLNVTYTWDGVKMWYVPVTITQTVENNPSETASSVTAAATTATTPASTKDSSTAQATHDGATRATEAASSSSILLWNIVTITTMTLVPAILV